MNTFTVEQDWLRQAMAQGILIPSSTLISGPGGSGKPLMAGMLLASWLKQQGDIIYLLINSDRHYAEKVLSLYGIDAHQYEGRIFYIDFDPQIEGWEEVAPFQLKANLLHPEIIDKTIQIAQKNLKTQDKPPLIFGAALNILLFSPTYGTAVFNKFYQMVQQGTHCLFTISNNVFEEQMAQLEAAADNLIFMHSEKIMELHLRIEKMKEVPFLKKDIIVPLSEDELRDMRSEAEKMRKHLIPMLRKI